MKAMVTYSGGCLPKRPIYEEFDGAFVRLLERYGSLDCGTLTATQEEYLSALVYDSPEFLRRDQAVLHDWARCKGIDMGRDAYLPNAPVLYMAALLKKHGYTRLEDALQDAYSTESVVTNG